MIRRLIYLMLTLLACTLLGGWAAYAQLDRTPGELLRYIERRLIGHPKLETIALPILHAVREQVEVPITITSIPDFGKGQRPFPLSQQMYTTEDHPLVTRIGDDKTSAAPATRMIASAAELDSAVRQAKAGEVLELLPGTYSLRQDLTTSAGGNPGQPIVLRAQRPGSVTLEFMAAEGMRIAHSYWHIENLVIRGKCREDRNCEHAFHVFGSARGIVIRNNLIEDYNAHIKVNGLNGAWPDDGLIQHNTIRNSRRRNTHLPVTPIDIVGANGWVIADNIISNFVKAQGNQVSYGAFMKGGGSSGRMERNLVICTPMDISQAGVRVGLSMGGGGTGKDYCRDKRCDTEHSKGLIINNVIAHCNDFGIDVNTANQTVIAHNTLINTSGIDLRQAMASALVHGNLLDGEIRARDGAMLESSLNIIGSPASRFADPAALELAWRKPPEPIATHPQVQDDFCGRVRGPHSSPGAFADIGDCR